MSTSLGTTIKAFSHYIDQRHVIDRVGKRAGWALGLGAPVGMLAWNTYKAKPEERKNTLIRNGLVLGGVILASLFAARKWLMYDVTEQGAKKIKSFLDPKDVAEARETLLKEFENIKNDLKNPLYRQYQNLPVLERLILKETKSLNDFKAIITHMKAASPKTYQKDLETMLPVDLGGDFPTTWAETKEFLKGIFLDDLGKFALVGSFPIFGGVLGGLAADKATGEHGKLGDMLKEGVFQFISNIFLPVMTATVGLTALSADKIKAKLENMPGNRARLIRGGVIGFSVAVGIASGMLLANKIGEKWLTPLFDRMQGKPPQPKSAEGKSERKADFWDVFLHVDDIPTALAVAGVKILMPFLPFLFGISGYRAGIGFRNGRAEHEKSPQPANAFPASGQAPGVFSHGAPPVPALSVLTAGTSPLQRERNHLFRQFDSLQGGGNELPGLAMAAPSMAPMLTPPIIPSTPFALPEMVPTRAFSAQAGGLR